MNASSAGAVVYGFGATFFVLAFNSPNVLSLTQDYPIFHLEVMALGLFSLFLGPLALFRPGLIKATECAIVLRAQTFGLIFGSVSILPLAVLSGLSAFYVGQAPQIIITSSLVLFFIVYDLTFSNFFGNVKDTEEPGVQILDFTSTKAFSRMLVVANIYPVTAIVALLLTNQFEVGLITLVFQAMASLAGFALRGLSIRWIRGMSSPKGQSASLAI